MNGLFVKDEDAYIPTVMYLLGVRKEGLVAADLELARLIRPTGSGIDISPQIQIVSAGNGGYLVTLCGTLIATLGQHTLMLSGSNLDGKDIDFQVTDLDFNDLKARLAQLSGSLTSPGVNVASLATAASEDVADKVWDEQTSGHVAAGSFGKLMQDISADVWTEATRTLTALGASTIDSIWEYDKANISGASAIGTLIKDALTGGDLSTITTHLTDIKGTGFVKDTHSLVQILVASLSGAEGVGIPNTDIAKVVSAILGEGITLAGTTVGSVGQALVQARANSVGKLDKEDANNLKLYDEDNVTEVAHFTLTNDGDGNPITRST